MNIFLIIFLVIGYLLQASFLSFIGAILIGHTIGIILSGRVNFLLVVLIGSLPISYWIYQFVDEDSFISFVGLGLVSSVLGVVAALLISMITLAIKEAMMNLFGVEK